MMTNKNEKLIFPFFKLGEKLSQEETDTVLAECMDPEDEDGFIPYVRKYRL